MWGPLYFIGYYDHTHSIGFKLFTGWACTAAAAHVPVHVPDEVSAPARASWLASAPRLHRYTEQPAMPATRARVYLKSRNTTVGSLPPPPVHAAELRVHRRLGAERVPLPRAHALSTHGSRQSASKATVRAAQLYGRGLRLCTAGIVRTFIHWIRPGWVLTIVLGAIAGGVAGMGACTAAGALVVVGGSPLHRGTCTLACHCKRAVHLGVLQACSAVLACTPPGTCHPRKPGAPLRPSPRAPCAGNRPAQAGQGPAAAAAATGPCRARR